MNLFLIFCGLMAFLVGVTVWLEEGQYWRIFLAIEIIAGIFLIWIGIYHG